METRAIEVGRQADLISWPSVRVVVMVGDETGDIADDLPRIWAEVLLLGVCGSSHHLAGDRAYWFPAPGRVAAAFLAAIAADLRDQRGATPGEWITSMAAYGRVLASATSTQTCPDCQALPGGGAA